MDARYAFLITIGIAGFWASFETAEPYSTAWRLIGAIALAWAIVITYKLWKRKPSKHGRDR